MNILLFIGVYVTVEYTSTYLEKKIYLLKIIMLGVNYSSVILGLNVLFEGKDKIVIVRTIWWQMRYTDKDDIVNSADNIETGI